MIKDLGEALCQIDKLKDERTDILNYHVSEVKKYKKSLNDIEKLLKIYQLPDEFVESIEKIIKQRKCC